MESDRPLPDSSSADRFQENSEAGNVPSDHKLDTEDTALMSKLRGLRENLPCQSRDKLLHHCLPITCLKLLEGGIVLVASEGPSILLKMAYFEDYPIQRFQLFPSQFIISGMEFAEYPRLECGRDPAAWHSRSDKPYDRVYVGFLWAGSVGTLIRITRTVNKGLDLLEDEGDRLSNELVNLDFIPVAAKWLDGGSVLVLLSILNYLVIYERLVKDQVTKLVEVERIQCTKSETLFSGAIAGKSRKDLRVFAGTVFNGICVWDILENGEAVIKYELKCHDGIIFSLGYYADRNLLLSTSDDRTVAAWQFSGTGDAEEVTLSRRFYGHDARVWKAFSVRGYIISIGESSDVRVNLLEDGTDHKVWQAHEGAPIFTGVYDEDFEILYTGGNDGSIKKWLKWWYRLKPRLHPYDVISDGVSDPDVSTRTQVSGRWLENKDYPKTVALLDLNYVLVSMNSGRVVGMSWEGQQFDLLYEENCEGFQIIKISPDHKTLAVSGNNGHFYTAQIGFSENQSSKTMILHAKKIFMTRISWDIISMIWLDCTRLLIICYNKAVALLLQDNDKGEKSEVQFIQTFDLNLQRPGVFAAVEIQGKYIMIGDDLGSLHLFRYHKSSEAVNRFEIHKDSVTSLLFYESRLYSCGRDGTVRTASLKINSEDDMVVDYIPLRTLSMSFDWVAGIYVNMGQLLISGFQKGNFIVHSLHEKHVIAKIPCGGGGNRKWDFKYGHGKDGSKNASFAFVKDKEIYYTFLPMDGYLNNSLKVGLHTRTISCAIQLSATKDECQYITGSEDGSLKWFQYSIPQQKILSLEKMEDHESSIRTVMWKTTVSSNTSLVFSGGGKSQLCIYELDHVNSSMRLLREVVLVKTTCKQTEGDVRVMDIVLVQGINCDSDELWCFNACSDGYVRVLYFNSRTQKFKIAGQLVGNMHAVMKIQILKADDEVTLCGVTSNGYLLLWNWNVNCGETRSNQPKQKNALPKTASVFSKLLRRTALLSLKVSDTINTREKDCMSYTVICGGDDCSVSVWTLSTQRIGDTVRYEISENWSNNQIQRGAVVGVDMDDKYIYTLSNDQIVGFWNWNGSLRKQLCAGVSDCQGFVVDSVNEFIMCFGKGVSWIPIRMSSSNE